MTAANARNAACTDTKDKISVCVFVSGGGTNLQALLDESKTRKRLSPSPARKTPGWKQRWSIIKKRARRKLSKNSF